MEIKDGTVLKWWNGCRTRTLVVSRRVDNLVALHDKDTQQLVVIQYEANINRAINRGVLAVQT